VYVAAGGSLAAFDAAGSIACSGVAKQCSALWNSPAVGAFGETIVAGGTVRVSDRVFGLPS
jgi:hypothetical protein